MFSLIAILVIAIRILYPVDFILIIPVFGTFAFAIFRLLPKLAGFGRYGMQITSALPDVELVYGVLLDDRYSKIEDGDKTLLELNSSIEFKYFLEFEIVSIIQATITQITAIPIMRSIQK